MSFVSYKRPLFFIVLLVSFLSVCFGQDADAFDDAQEFTPRARESSVRMGESEKTKLERQRARLSKLDKEAALTERELRAERSESTNTSIDENAKTFTGVAAGEKKRFPSSGDLPLSRIKNIENIKRNILRFKKYYDEDSVEVASLMEGLEDAYSELESDTYVATAFSDELILRCGSYDEVTKSWPVEIYSELFGLAGLFHCSSSISYKDLISRCGNLQGSSNFAEGGKHNGNVLIADSLFRKRVPLVFPILEYKVIRGVNASQYYVVPVCLRVFRTDRLKTVLELYGSDGLEKGAFYMQPEFAVKTAEASAGDAFRVAQDVQEQSPVRLSFFDRAFAKQIKRRTAYISVDTALPASGAFHIRDITLNSVKLNVDFAPKDFFYLGGGFSWIYRGKNIESDYSIFTNVGVNTTLFGVVRPYVQLEAAFDTDSCGTLAFGGGTDLILDRFVLNFNYAYNWIYNFKVDVDRLSNAFVLGIGLGLGW